MQILKTKQFGDITFEKTWVDGSIHIGRLAGGGYLHVTGQPIASEHEIRAAIPKGPHLDDALRWYKDRDKEPEGVKRRIMINNDGSYAFDSGDPVVNLTELIQCIPPGPALDAAIMWFTEHHKTVKAEQAEARIAGKPIPKPKAPVRKAGIINRPAVKLPVAMPIAAPPQSIVD